MKFIGITGGVGAGKTTVLSYLAQKENVRILLADEIAHELMKPPALLEQKNAGYYREYSCYDEIHKTFDAEDIFLPDGQLDKGKMAAAIFTDAKKREQINQIVHPAVKRYVLDIAAEERKKGELSFLFLEAALLIEEHYDKICDELWYIFASEETRRERLMSSRGYSSEKVLHIFSSQLPEETYRSYAAVVIDNDGNEEKTQEEIEKALLRVSLS